MLTSRREDDGSIVVAMTVIMLLGALAMVVLARVDSGQASARQSYEQSAAMGPADAGVADVLVQLDQLEEGELPPSPFCVGSAACGAGKLSLAASPSTAYVATYDPVEDTVTVRSRGEVNGQRAGVEAVIRRGKLYRFAIFGVNSLRFNGNSGGQIVTVDANGAQIASPDANAGSNGSIECKGASGGGENNVGDSVGDACDNPDILEPGTFSPQPPVAQADCSTVPENVPPTPCYPGNPSIEACPADGSGLLPAVLQPGKYLCNRMVKFREGNTTINTSSATNGGVVQLFVMPPAGTPVAVDLKNANVNVTSTGADGDPTDLRVYVKGSGEVTPGPGNNAGRFVGIMYAPESNMTSNGCKVVWRGAITFASVECNGGPNLTVLYDARVAALTDDNWTVKNYRPAPSTGVVLP